MRFVCGRKKKFLLEQIGNADETPVWFDMPSGTTVSQHEAKEVKLISTGSQKAHFTVMLACAADGRKLPPFIIFKRKTMPKESFPRDVSVWVNEKGYMDEASCLSGCALCGIGDPVRSCGFRACSFWTPFAGT